MDLDFTDAASLALGLIVLWGLPATVGAFSFTSRHRLGIFGVPFLASTGSGFFAALIFTFWTDPPH